MRRTAVMARGLGFRYPSADQDAFRDVSLSIRAGEHALFYGPSGGGKSTLARFMAGAIPFLSGGHARGVLRVMGANIGAGGPGSIQGLTALVPQEPEGHMLMGRVWSEIAAPRASRDRQALEITPELLSTAAEFGIGELLDRETRALSGGEGQMVSMAASAYLDRPVTVMDEPLSQQSRQGRRRFRKIMEAMGDRTVLVFEHRTAGIADLFDRFFLVADGTVRETDRDSAVSHERGFRMTPVKTVRTGPPVLTMRGVSFEYPGRPVLAGLDLDLPRGISVIGGENGSGKSTLAKLMMGILRPSKGDIKRPRTALLLQDSRYYFVTHRLRDDIAVQCSEFGMDPRRAAAIFNGLGLRDLDRDPARLSVGERVRAAVGLLLITRPELLVLDEPTRGLDPGSKIKLVRSLLRFCGGGMSMAVITHDEFLAGALGGESHIIRKGRAEVAL